MVSITDSCILVPYFRHNAAECLQKFQFPSKALGSTVHYYLNFSTMIIVTEASTVRLKPSVCLRSAFSQDYDEDAFFKEP